MSRIGSYHAKTHSRDTTINMLKIVMTDADVLYSYTDYGGIVSSMTQAGGGTTAVTVNLRDKHKNIMVIHDVSETDAAHTDVTVQTAVVDSDTFTVLPWEGAGQAGNYEVNLLVCTCETVVAATVV